MKVSKYMLILLLLLLGSLITYQTTASIIPDQEDTEDDDKENTEEDEDHDEIDDEINDETKEKYEREVEVEENDREWKIKSEMKNGENKDKFEVEFKVGGGDEPEIELKYATESSSSELELKYRVNFDKLLEFSETNNVLGYDNDLDNVVSIYELGKMDWDPIGYDTQILDDVLVHTASVTTSDGIFGLVLKISEGIVNLENMTITPNAIKIDVIIDGYNFLVNGTYLTLQTDIKTEAETQYEEESEDEDQGFAVNEEQVSVNSNQAAAFFSWVDNAMADGQIINVIASSLQTSTDQDDDLEEDEKHQIIYFTFNSQNPNRIVWDPKVGVGLPLTSSNGFTLPFSIIGPVIVLLAIPIKRRLY